jgi:hypothetical protein
MADAVGDQMPVEPTAEGVSPETAADVAATLIDSANKLVEEGGGMPAEPMPEEAALKTSAAQDLNTRAGEQAYAIMVKAAQQTKEAVGSTIEGGDKGNKQTDTPAAETVMEAKNRPEMQHVVGEGNTQSGAGRGTGVVGKEDVGADTPDGAPNESPSGTNSVLEQSKMGTLREIIQKVAMGSTIQGGDKGNKGTDTPAAETVQEFQRRPEGYAENMLARSDLPVTPAATVGTEQPQPVQPGESPAGSTPGETGNSVVEWSNESKTGEAEDPFIALFRKTAEMVGSSLPISLPEETKIAHLRQMMGMTDPERAEYIGLLHKEAGSSDDEAVEATKTAACKMRDHRSRYSGNPGRKDRRSGNQKTAELPPEFLANKKDKKDDGEKKEDKEDKKDKDDKKEMKGEEMPFEMKEGSDLLSRIRRVSQQGASA